MLTGISTDSDEGIKASALALSDKGVDQVVITLGSRGAYVLDHNRRGHFVSAPKVKAVDTTAAGDCFNGALVVALSEGMSLIDAVAFGCKAASLSVQVSGAQPSLPTRKAVDLNKND